ncbi:MAG: hypothetical protein U9N10_01720, partial [Bacillota bacterium]|nr:hypothetical protein [Bacillota bacterium]
MNIIKKNHIAFLSISIILVLLFIPLISLIFNVLKSNNEIKLTSIISNRRLFVIFKTISFSALVSILATFTGLFLATYTYLNKKKLFYLFIFLIMFISVPPYIYALSFIEFFSFFNNPVISGLGISILVQTVYYIPFASLLFYIHIKGIHKSYFDETNLHLSTIKSSFITIKELSFAAFSLIFLMILLLSINNYAIPSIFAFNTYPIEIMSVFSNSNNLLTTTLITLPFLFF